MPADAVPAVPVLSHFLSHLLGRTNADKTPLSHLSHLDMST